VSPVNAPPFPPFRAQLTHRASSCASRPDPVIMRSNTRASCRVVLLEAHISSIPESYDWRSTLGGRRQLCHATQIGQLLVAHAFRSSEVRIRACNTTFSYGLASDLRPGSRHFTTLSLSPHPRHDDGMCCVFALF